MRPVPARILLVLVCLGVATALLLLAATHHWHEDPDAVELAAGLVVLSWFIEKFP